MSNTSIRRDFEHTDFESTEALIVWNALVEPGDRVASDLLRSLGPKKALDSFLNRQDLGTDALDAYERWAPRYSPTLAAEKLKIAKKQDLKLLLPTDKQWPRQLDDLGPHAPLLLWYRGNPEHFHSLQRSVGLIGSRNATQYGQRVTSELAAKLVLERAVVVSGGALGIDSVAHRTALKLEGVTVAFMAGGLDSLYPAANFELFESIGHSGLLLSEMSPGARPTRWRFLQRNRLIAALSEATVVTEAGWRSGSINTVNHANELGRKVFAVPGPISSPASAGCNRLIRDGQADMVLDVDDLPTELGWRTSLKTTFDGMGTLELRALDALDGTFQTLQEILRASGLSMQELRTALGALKMIGMVENDQNHGWKRSETR